MVVHGEEEKMGNLQLPSLNQQVLISEGERSSNGLYSLTLQMVASAMFYLLCNRVSSKIYSKY